MFFSLGEATSLEEGKLWIQTWRWLHKNPASNIEYVLEATLHKAAAIPTTHHENYQN